MVGVQGWLALIPDPARLWSGPALLRDAQWVLLAYTLYGVALMVAGLAIHQRPRRPRDPRKRFAIVIPAHNERLVLRELLASCRALDYPRRLFDVFVVADNCTDDTAEVARAEGAQVLTRYDAVRRGKGYALEDAFASILGATVAQPYDAVVVFDADNLVAPDFLDVMNAELLEGHTIIQARPDVKNPQDTWVAATFGMAFWVSSRFWYLAKHRLGLSAALGGTGMCIATDTLRQIGWNAFSLTEDLEFSTKALLLGHRTHWAHDAIIYDEKPLLFGRSYRQRVRWAQGQTQVMARYLPRLLWEGVRRGSLVRLEGALALMQPFYIMVSSVVWVVGPALSYMHVVQLSNVGGTLWVPLAIVNYLLPVLAVTWDRLPAGTLRYLPLYPVFVLSTVPITWAGVLSARNRTWSHTLHTRAITYGELTGVRVARRGLRAT